MSNLTRYNGKCRTCKTGYSVLARRTNQYAALGCYVVIGNTYVASLQAMEGEDGTLYPSISGGSIDRVCCDTHVVMAPVRGKVKLSKKCDARCQNALGHDCECACGGKHHGSGHPI